MVHDQHSPDHEAGAGHGPGAAHGPAAGHGHGHSHSQDHGRAHSRGHGHGGLPEILDLDAEVAAPQLAALTARVAALTEPGGVKHILDLGSGTGSGTFALLRRFPEASATAVDTSAEMLSHLMASARRHGSADRIHPLRADLDEGWPTVEPAGLIWASSSIHHLTDPDAVLRQISRALPPGGLFVMLEMEHMPRFLPDDLGFGTPGLESRLHAAAEEARNRELPHIGSEWTTRLTAAGLTVRDHHTLDVELAGPLPEAALRYARTTLQRFAAGSHLGPDDHAALHRLLDGTGPEALENRGDVRVHSSRTVWICAPAR